MHGDSIHFVLSRSTKKSLNKSEKSNLSFYTEEQSIFKAFPSCAFLNKSELYCECFYILNAHHARKDFGKPFNSCYRFGFPSSETVLKLIERLANRVGVRNLCIVYKCDVSHSPSLTKKKKK